MDFSLELLPEQPLVELIDVICIADELGFRACYSARRDIPQGHVDPLRGRSP
jgi:hypothetical protein